MRRPLNFMYTSGEACTRASGMLTIRRFSPARGNPAGDAAGGACVEGYIAAQSGAVNGRLDPAGTQAEGFNAAATEVMVQARVCERGLEFTQPGGRRRGFGMRLQRHLAFEVRVAAEAGGECSQWQIDGAERELALAGEP